MQREGTATRQSRWRKTSIGRRSARAGARPRDLRQGLAILGKLARHYEAAAKRVERDGDRDALRFLVSELPWFRKQLEKLPELVATGREAKRIVQEAFAAGLRSDLPRSLPRRRSDGP
jgi:hypothetical protein